MCGIAGLYHCSGALSDPEIVIRSMIDTLVHRGPDAEGLWIDERRRCALGHRRLSIIDTSDAGRQPMIGGGGQWVVAFNGEIYNFLEIREQLEAKGVRFHGRTDTEVLIEAIAFWGTEALPKLDGMFALAAFNNRSGELIVARDAFGEKPLYYVNLPGGVLAFASELQALEKLANFDAEVSLDAMAEVLMFQYIGAPRTIYRSVRKLPPGHWMRLVPDQPATIGRFFEFRPGAGEFDTRPRATLVDELDDILVRSIRRRLISDVPLGAFLSGGIDSSTVCALIRHRLGLPLKTFSIGFRDAPESEHEEARMLAKHIGSDHHDRVLSPDTSAFLSGIGRVLDEPNGDSSCMPTYLLAEFARRQVTVAVSGDGGDELFVGYGRYFSTLEEERVAVRGAEWHPGHAYYSDRILVSTEKYVEELFGDVPGGLARHLKGLRDEVADTGQPLFCGLRKTDVENYLPGAVLPKVDRMSMQHSLEVRTPYLNMELARFAERLPLDVLYRDGQGKLLLRELASRYLPREIVNAPKKGFGLPMARWARDPLLTAASSLLECGESRLRQVLGAEAVERFMARQRSRDGFSTYQVWALTMLESWLRHHPAKMTAVTDLLREGRGQAIVRGRSGSKALFAWPVGEKEFSVVEDVDQPIEPETAAGETASLDKPLKLPQWGAAILPQELSDLSLLRGATLRFLDSEVSQRLTGRELDKFVALGVREIEYSHPHLPDGTFLQIRLQRKTLFQRFLAWMRLRRHVVARLGWRRRWELIRDVRQGKVQQGQFFSFGPLSGYECPLNEDMSHRFMLFEGLEQVPPIPSPHSEVAAGRSSRYSVWNNECYFSPRRFRRLLTHSYWLVERTPQTEPHLQYVCTVIPASHQCHLEMAALLEECIRTERLPADRSFTAESPIIVMTHGLPPGGAERQWCYLAAGTKAENQKVMFVSINQLTGSDGHYLPLLQRDNVPVVELRGCPARDLLHGGTMPQEVTRMLLRARSPLPPGVLLRLTALLHRLRPRAIIAQLDGPNILAAVAGLLAGVPRIVLSFRNYNPSHFSYLRNDWFQRYYQVVAQSSRVILAGNSPDANDDYARWIGVATHQVHCIPNCIDTRDVERPALDRVTALRTELAVKPDAQVVLGVFRCSEEKRPLLFLEACAKIQKEVPNVRVAIVGSGPLEGAMRQFIERSNLQGVATMLGRRGDIAALMGLASLLLLTSEKEGMPNVVMEAQALGLPVVAARTGGVPDLVEHGQSGFIVNGDDPADFARACISILQDENLAKKMGQSGAARMRGRFSRTSMAKEYLRIIAETDANSVGA